jgi:membrane protein implicated in regulation of membrane protease activity
MKLSTLALIEFITGLVAFIWFASIIATITFFVLAILDKASWNTFFLVFIVGIIIGAIKRYMWNLYKSSK